MLPLTTNASITKVKTPGALIQFHIVICHNAARSTHQVPFHFHTYGAHHIVATHFLAQLSSFERDCDCDAKAKPKAADFESCLRLEVLRDNARQGRI